MIEEINKRCESLIVNLNSLPHWSKQLVASKAKISSQRLSQIIKKMDNCLILSLRDLQKINAIEKALERVWKDVFSNF